MSALDLDPHIDAYIEQLTRDWPPPDSPNQLRVLRRVFGPHLTQNTGDGLDPAKNPPAAGGHRPQKEAAA